MVKTNIADHDSQTGLGSVIECVANRNIVRLILMTQSRNSLHEEQVSIKALSSPKSFFSSSAAFQKMCSSFEYPSNLGLNFRSEYIQRRIQDLPDGVGRGGAGVGWGAPIYYFGNFLPKLLEIE